tara:strand:+ start:461 stop:1087 length:627 start_codon:yes stop_codon:yes gene_type:complete
MAVLTNFGVPMGGTAANNGTLMPKLQYRFRVTFNNLAGSTSPLVTQNVVSATRPGIDHEAIIIDTYNSKINLAGKHTWQDITVVLRDDSSNNVIKAIQKQLNDQVNHTQPPVTSGPSNAMQQSAPAGSSYKFAMSIQTLDGGQDINNTDVLDTWVIEGCYIAGATFGDLNYATSDVVQVQMTIRYDNARLMGPSGTEDIGTGDNLMAQ